MRLKDPLHFLKNNRHVIFGFIGTFCGIFFGIIVSHNRRSTEGGGNYTFEFDRNGDGKNDASYHYEKGIIARTELDRNFDSANDYWEWYEDGLASRGESDDNFDGKIDSWFTNKNGNWWLSKHDTDINGVPDVFNNFEHGVIKLAVWRPNESKKFARIEFYEKAIKARELLDTTGDGLIDTDVRFDVFGNQVSVEKLGKPLSLEEVYSQSSR